MAETNLNRILAPRENLARILDNLKEGVIAHDLKRRIFFFNNQAEQITGKKFWAETATTLSVSLFAVNAALSATIANWPPARSTKKNTPSTSPPKPVKPAVLK